MEYYPPLSLPPRRLYGQVIRRPFNLDPDIVLCYLPEIDTLWRDQSRYGNDGTLSGPTKVNTGRRGQALSFDGVDDRVTFLGASSLQNFTQFTVDFWIKPVDIGGAGTARTVVISGLTGVGSFNILISSGVVGRIQSYAKNDAGANDIAFNDGLTTANKWYHCAIVNDGAEHKVFVNGVEGTSKVLVGPYACTGNWQFSSSTNDYQGLADEFRIWRRALTDQEVSALYEQGKP